MSLKSWFSSASLAVCLLGAGCFPAGAGAWTQASGEGQVIVTGLYSEAMEAFDADGVSQAIPVFHKAELSAYAEYGIIDGVTILARTEFRTVASGETVSVDAARFGLTGLGARVRLFEGRGAVVSAEVFGRLPLGAEADEEGLPDGEVDLRLLAGYGFEIGTWSAFADVAGAYRFRPGAPSDEVRGDLTLGFRPRPTLLLLVQSFNTIKIEASADTLAAPSEHKLQLSAVYDVTERVSVQLGGIATVAGRDALCERGLLTAIWYRF